MENFSFYFGYSTVFCVLSNPFTIADMPLSLLSLSSLPVPSPLVQFPDILFVNKVRIVPLPTKLDKCQTLTAFSKVYCQEGGKRKGMGVERGGTLLEKSFLPTGSVKKFRNLSLTGLR